MLFLLLLFIHAYLSNGLMDVEKECEDEENEAEWKICLQLAKWTKNNRENVLNKDIICNECNNCKALEDPKITWTTEECKSKCTKKDNICFMGGGGRGPCQWSEYKNLCDEGKLIEHASNGCPDRIDECLDLNCFDGYFYNMKRNFSQLDCFRSVDEYQRTLISKKAIRKEYRIMSDVERERFIWALKQLKMNGKFYGYAGTHGDFALGGSAHAGPGFLPWHREFLKRFEFELRKMDRLIALPYWDTALDARLPDPRDSVLWTNELLGATDLQGYVIDGPFANFKAINWTEAIDPNKYIEYDSHSHWAHYERFEYEENFAIKYKKFMNPHITRKLGMTDNSRLMNDRDINWFLSQTQIEAILAHPLATSQNCPFNRDHRTMEWIHGQVHIWVGGDMDEQTTTANDPTFYLLHSFVDLLWEHWRQTHQNRDERENQYPIFITNCSSSDHMAKQSMVPFTLWDNMGGLKNAYTDYLYNYQERPTCSQMRPDCDSKYLFCDKSHGEPQCVSKVKLGGNCQGFINGEDVCYKSVCIEGRCQDLSNNCYNQHSCCATWAARGECYIFPGYMRINCPASCEMCQPNYNISLECADRSPNCFELARRGDCSQFSKIQWMNENCRRTCNKCDRTREQLCNEYECADYHYECVQQANLYSCRDRFIGTHCCATCRRIANQWFG